MGKKKEGVTCVSIPHRYGKNSNSDAVVIPITVFPFLIGTVRTQSLSRYGGKSAWVSIPHRYGKNLVNLRVETRDSQVSIPHRYGKN